jgi:hypothetical protein
MTAIAPPQQGNVSIADATTATQTLVVNSDGSINSKATSYSYANITTKTDTAVKASAGHLHAIVINKAGSSDTLTVYDNTAASGTKIASITVTASVGFVYLYDCAFSTGLTITSGGTTAGDYTVIYR